jgi:hypothetical protein
MHWGDRYDAYPSPGLAMARWPPVSRRDDTPKTLHCHESAGLRCHCPVLASGSTAVRCRPTAFAAFGASMILSGELCVSATFGLGPEGDT